MGKVLKCDLCEQPATVHLTQIVNNKIHKVDLCEKCAQEKGVTDPNGFSLADLLMKGNPDETPASGSPGLSCPTCGCTEKDFQTTGRLGCPDCYETFAEILHPLLRKMHKGTHHTGKVPVRALARKTLLEKIQMAEDQLQQAIGKEEYEKAAKFRDQIKELKDEFSSAPTP
ncbi:MAG: UvrB/UvrC motif-containing protein [Opitutales bacterium]|nr:UvrB/UvrC motif-containing protein [Opitutales bacterium]